MTKLHMKVEEIIWIDDTIHIKGTEDGCVYNFTSPYSKKELALWREYEGRGITLVLSDTKFEGYKGELKGGHPCGF